MAICIKDYPEAVRLLVPNKMGSDHESIFDAHGNRFYCKRLSRDTWCLECPLKTPRTRFGNKLEIMEDIQACLNTGVLPGKPGRP